MNYNYEELKRDYDKKLDHIDELQKANQKLVVSASQNIMKNSKLRQCLSEIQSAFIDRKGFDIYVRAIEKVLNETAPDRYVKQKIVEIKKEN